MGILTDSLVTTCLTIVVLLVTAVYLYFKYSFNYWSKLNVKYLEPTFPFGNLKDLFLQKLSFGDMFADIYKNFKGRSIPAGGFYFLNKPMVMLTDPELIKTIFSKEFGSFHDRDFYYNEKVDPLSAHLVALRGSHWRTLRAKLTPTFTSGKMKMMFHTMKDCTKGLNELIKAHADSSEAIDIREVFARLTTDTILSCAFGIECASIKNPDNEFRKYGKMIFEFGFRDNILNALTNYPWLLDFLQIPVTNPKVTKFFMTELQNIVNYREKNNVHRKDFLDLLIRLKNNQSVLDDSAEKNLQDSDAGQGLTFNELAAQAFVFFAAGFETTSSTLNFCLYELTENLDIQQKLQNEVREVLQKYNGDICYDSLRSMKYMDKVIQEVLRKYPPIPILNRECTQDYFMPEFGATIKRGITVIISTLGLQRDPELYPNPEKFDPERFSEEEKVSRHPFAYLPFGEGPRICIGTRFAFLQVKLVLTMLLKDFKFTLDSKTVTPVCFDAQNIFLAPKDTIWIQAHVSQ